MDLVIIPLAIMPREESFVLACIGGCEKIHRVTLGPLFFYNSLSELRELHSSCVATVSCRQISPGVVKQ